MSRAIGVVVAGASLVACGPGYSKLNVAELQSLTLATEGQAPGFCAYAPVPLRALVTYRNGDHAQSRIPGEDQRGRLRTSEFEWSSSHGTVDGDAVLTLPVDPLVWYDQPILVKAHVIARPEIAGETTAQPRFDCGGTLDLRGSAGARGGEAEDGGPGAPGPVVEAALAYIETERSGRLVLVRAQRDGEEPEYFVIAPPPTLKPIIVDARGGAGGRGGQGPPGVDGRAGFDAGCAGVSAGQPGENGVPGSPGGPGRNGSAGGPGGRVRVHYDGRFPELRSLVEVNVDGGEAGGAGAGGPGGRGGRHGRGCAGIDGSVGNDGVDGAAGPVGTAGQPGSPGAPGDVEDAAMDVAALFAAELARGLPIVTGAGGVP